MSEETHQDARALPLVDKWIHEATRTLIPEAQERIRAEIRTHVSNTMEREGATEEDAVKKLGPTWDAWKKNRKVYLTDEDAIEIVRTNGPKVPNLSIVWLIVLPVFPIMLVWMLNTSFELEKSGYSDSLDRWMMIIGSTLIFLSNLLCAVSSFKIRNKQMLRDTNRVIWRVRLSTMAYAQQLPMALLFPVFITSSTWRAEPMFAGIFILFAVPFAIFLSSLRRPIKILRNTEDCIPILKRAWNDARGIGDV